jgi:cardiolipin synthase
MPQWLTLPNLFTLARMALVPFILFELVNRQPAAALALFAIAAATDVVDGYLARHLHTVTKAGAYLDPIADKILLSGIYLALAAIGSFPWWLVGIIFGRDLLIVAASVVALLTTPLRAFPPSVWGKASTLLQVITAVAFLARNAIPTRLFATASDALIWPVAALTIWSGIHYGWRGVRLLRMH